MQNGYVESFNGRIPDELLNETPFLSMAHARVEIATWVENYNQDRLHSSLQPRLCATRRAESNPSWEKAVGHVTDPKNDPSSMFILKSAIIFVVDGRCSLCNKQQGSGLMLSPTKVLI